MSASTPAPLPTSQFNCLFPTFACLFSTLHDRDVVKTYDGYQVLRLNISTPSAFESIKSVFLSEEYDFWNPPSMAAPTDIMVPPQLAESLKTFLGIVGLPFEVIYSNLQE
jgi:hypothetical protein